MNLFSYNVCILCMLKVETINKNERKFEYFIEINISKATWIFSFNFSQNNIFHILESDFLKFTFPLNFWIFFYKFWKFWITLAKNHQIPNGWECIFACTMRTSIRTAAPSVLNIDLKRIIYEWKNVIEKIRFNSDKIN